MDLKTLVTRTLEKKGVLAKIRVKFPHFILHLSLISAFPRFFGLFFDVNLSRGRLQLI